jgi:hypothetical protein
MLSRCSASSCEGFLEFGLLVSCEGSPAKRVCGPCVLGCSDKVCILEEVNDANTGGLVQTGTIYMIDPSRWSRDTLVRLKLECQPSTIDFYACNTIRQRIARLLAKRVNRNIVNVSSFLSQDAKTLWVKNTLHFIIPDGLSNQSAICVDASDCDLCSTSTCHYQVQCEECSQFTCGTWVRLKGTCAYCRHTMPR